MKRVLISPILHHRQARLSVLFRYNFQRILSVFDLLRGPDNRVYHAGMALLPTVRRHHRSEWHNMVTIGLIGLALGTLASAGGVTFRMSTFQGPGNYRIPVGTAVSFLGGIIVSMSVVQVLLSIF